MSFPSILREDGVIYVYPESAYSGHLSLYQYDPDKESLVYKETICDDSVWDSVITDYFGDDLLFTANKNDYYLDIYKWSPESSRYIPYMTLQSPKKNSRMAGQFFRYKGDIYCPRQDCTHNYGGATNICRVSQENGSFQFSLVKKLRSPHKTRREALHTFNEFKGVVIIDVKGYDYPFVGKPLKECVRWAKRKLKRK